MFSLKTLLKYSKTTFKVAAMQIEVPVNCVKRTYYNNQNLRKIFLKSLDSVNTKTLIKNNVKINDENLIICDRNYSLKNNNIYMVGFGKAVFNMAVELEAILGDQLVKGIVSVPTGTNVAEYEKQMAGKTKIIFYEGAKDNQPDSKSLLASEEIFKFVGTLGKNDLVLVLISGGGSALLTLPISPINLSEKADLIKKLGKYGANITELNTVRKRLSQVKGGGLARKAFPAYIVSLILSDVIGDPLDIIASGPTVPNKDDLLAAYDIIKKYGLLGEVSKNILKILKTPIDDCDIPLNPLGNYFNVENNIIGNNKLMVAAAKEEALNRGYSTAVLSTRITADVNTLAKSYAELATDIGECILGLSSTAFLSFKYDEDTVLNLKHSLKEILHLDYENKQGVCILAAGEPVVHVLGKGIGGRNQHLALQFSIAMKSFMMKTPGLEQLTISFLSCGTDGIDGPTDAAGALGSSILCPLAAKVDLDPERFLRNSDSNRFYTKFLNGDYIVKTGHTGTNVMDLHCLVINKMFPKDEFDRKRSSAGQKC